MSYIKCLQLAMKYEYIRIRLCGPDGRYASPGREAVPNIENRINELGEVGWRLIHSENDGFQITFALMERVSGQDEAAERLNMSGKGGEQS